MKSINEDEMEIAVRLLLRIFQLEPRNLVLFDLPDLPSNELRHNPIFIRHVKVSDLFEIKISKILRRLNQP